MKAQFLVLWDDFKAWVSTHPAISIMAVTIVILALIAWAR